MKKILLLFTVVAMALTASAQKTWNFSDDTFSSKTSLTDETVDGLSVVGTMNITENKKTFEGIPYTHRLQTGGKSSKTNRVLKFDVPGACAISAVFCSASSSDASRVMTVAAGDYDNAIGTAPAPTSVGKATIEYNGTAPTTIFIYVSGGINFYSISYTTNDDPAGIADIVADENAPVEYFNLQGIRVDNPENGLYIRRQGNKVTKVIVK